MLPSFHKLSYITRHLCSRKVNQQYIIADYFLVHRAKRILGGKKHLINLISSQDETMRILPVHNLWPFVLETEKLKTHCNTFPGLLKRFIATCLVWKVQSHNAQLAAITSTRRGKWPEYLPELLYHVQCDATLATILLGTPFTSCCYQCTETWAY